MTAEARPDETWRKGWKWISKRVRPLEDRRFLLGKGKFVNDVWLPGMLHVAVVVSPHSHARILGIDPAEALRTPGVAYVLTGAELARYIDPIPCYLDIPEVKWYPLAVGKARYAGEWVAAVVAMDRYVAEDAAEKVHVAYEPLPPVLDPETALQPDSPLVHEEHGSNVALHRVFTWGEVERDFEEADRTVSLRLCWHRHSGVPIETFGVVAEYDESTGLLNIWASIQMPEYPEHIARALRLPLNHVRVFHDVDVGGSFGVKRGIKHTVLAGYLSCRLGRPVKFIEDRLEHMSGGEAHGPDRIIYVDVAASADGILRSLKMRVIDDNGAYFTRGALQLGKPIGACVGPYRIQSMRYEVISVATNKTGQAPVRGFGQSPHNFALERAVDAVARELGMDRIEIRRRNLIRREEFPYTIPSGTSYDSGDYRAVLRKVLELSRFDELLRQQEEARTAGRYLGIGLATCVEPSGGNAVFLPLLNPKQEVSTFPESAAVRIDSHGQITASIGFSSAGQGHETLVAQVLAEAFDLPPDQIVVVRSNSLEGLPTLTPVASRMSVMLPTAVMGAAERVLHKARAIAAHALEIREEDVAYRAGRFYPRGHPGRGLSLQEVAWIAHRQYHRMPPGLEPGLQATFVAQVPAGGRLPDRQGRVQMYPAYGFSAHVPVVEVDPDTCTVRLLDYFVVHDCGTIINPDIVRGMVVGGIAQGIGAALYEEFVYDETGQLLTQSFTDYLLPTVAEVPPITLGEHETPSPRNPTGAKGVGEGGYMTAPAALCSAVEDALAPLGVTIREIPMSPQRLFTLIHKETGRGKD